MLRTIAAFDRIGEENAFAVLARANALIAQGRDVINLGIGSVTAITATRPPPVSPRCARLWLPACTSVTRWRSRRTR